MKLICKNGKSFFVDKITIIEVLKFFVSTARTFKVLELNSCEGVIYYYTSDISNMKTIQEIIDFFESKENLLVDSFSINIDGIIIDIDDDYALNAFSEDISRIETFAKMFCSEVLKYNDDLIEKIFHLDGKYAMVDLGVIIKEFLSFDDYLEEME